jgi:hypothetical protein
VGGSPPPAIHRGPADEATLTTPRSLAPAVTPVLRNSMKHKLNARRSFMAMSDLSEIYQSHARWKIIINVEERTKTVLFSRNEQNSWSDTHQTMLKMNALATTVNFPLSSKTAKRCL